MNANGNGRRPGIEIERQLTQLERKLLSNGFLEAANLVGAAAISVSEALLDAEEDQPPNPPEFDAADLPVAPPPGETAEYQRGRR
jgi:hypothetical protein